MERIAPRVCVINLGCKVNRVESDWMETAFAGAGATLAPESAADIVAINTCAVTGEAEAKTRKAVRHAANLPQRPLVAVTGCVANLFPRELEELAPNVCVLPGKLTLAADAVALWEKTSRPADAAPSAPTAPGPVAPGSAAPTAPAVPAEPARAAHSAAPDPAVSDPEVFSHEQDLEEPVRHAAFRSRRGVKVQDGCDNRCTYCIVWKARGASASMPLDLIERQVQDVLAEGADEVVLSGINLAKYRGTDACGASFGLDGLLDRVCALGPGLVRLSSIEPPDLTDAVVAAMVRNADRVAAHLHLPLQAGSTSTLARMGRTYTAEGYAQVVARIRAALPQVSLSTDVIVGFPGETDGEFEETLAFCRAMGFSKIHAFRYSPRPGTAAASMPDQVPAPVARARSERLRAVAGELRAADAARRVGTEEPVLVEYLDEDGAARGTTASYHDVVLPAGTRGLEAPGLLRVKLTGVDGNRLVGVAALRV